MARLIGRTGLIREAPIIKLLEETEGPWDTVSLGQGVPFFPPPDTAVQAASEALTKEEGYRYSPDAGLLSLRQAVAEKVERENGFMPEPKNNIIITAGANQGFMNAVLAISNPGDEFIVLSPVYFNHIMALQMAECVPVISHVDENYQPNLKDIKKKFGPKTRAIVTISPNNPTGAVYSTDILRKINRFCAENGIYHISDEAYEHFLFDDQEHMSPGAFDPYIDHTITLFSCSKSYGMPGYRIGYMTYPKRLHRDLLKVQDTLVICPPAPSQAAAEAVLRNAPDYPHKWTGIMSEVRGLFKTAFADLGYAEMPHTKGGYYFLIKLKTEMPTWDLAKRLIEEYGVITLPGEMFDAPWPCLRVSYGNIDLETAEKGIRRLKKGLEDILL